MKFVVSNKKEDKPDYNSISSALDNANDYDQIYIKPGNYNGFFTISKNIQLIGDGNPNEINIFYKYENNSDKDLDNLVFITEYVVKTWWFFPRSDNLVSMTEHNLMNFSLRSNNPVSLTEHIVFISLEKLPSLGHTIFFDVLSSLMLYPIFCAKRRI